MHPALGALFVAGYVGPKLSGTPAAAMTCALSVSDGADFRDSGAPERGGFLQVALPFLSDASAPHAKVRPWPSAQGSGPRRSRRSAMALPGGCPRPRTGIRPRRHRCRSPSRDFKLPSDSASGREPLEVVRAVDPAPPLVTELLEAAAPAAGQGRSPNAAAPFPARSIMGRVCLAGGGHRTRALSGPDRPR